MPRYFCVRRNSTDNSTDGSCESPPSPAEMQSMYEAFESWRTRFEAQIVDLGGRLGSEGRVVRPGESVDGPFAEAKEIIAGFMIIEAESLDEAVAIASACPGVVSASGSLEVRPITTP